MKTQRSDIFCLFQRILFNSGYLPTVVMQVGLFPDWEGIEYRSNVTKGCIECILSNYSENVFVGFDRDPSIVNTNINNTRIINPKLHRCSFECSDTNPIDYVIDSDVGIPDVLLFNLSDVDYDYGLSIIEKYLSVKAKPFTLFLYDVDVSKLTWKGIYNKVKNVCKFSSRTLYDDKKVLIGNCL